MPKDYCSEDIPLSGNFVKWYCCYTCGYFEYKSVCTVCARKCHKSHKLTQVQPPKYVECKCKQGGKCAATRKDSEYDSAPESLINRDSRKLKSGHNLTEYQDLSD